MTTKQMAFFQPILIVIFLLSLSGCSSWFESKPDKQNPLTETNTNLQGNVPQNGASTSQTLTDNIASPLAEPIQPEIIDVTKGSYIDQKYGDETPETETEVLKTESVDPNKALKWLKNGNKRFVTGSLRADGQSQKDVKRLADKETPHAVVFTTSDSRVPPEIIFDEKLGEIHVVRNLGLTVDNSVLNSIDYAVGSLGSKLVIVLDRSYVGKEIDFSHADQTTQKLVDSSVILRTKLSSKDVMIVPAVYNIETGKVIFGK